MRKKERMAQSGAGEVQAGHEDKEMSLQGQSCVSKQEPGSALCPKEDQGEQRGSCKGRGEQDGAEMEGRQSKMGGDYSLEAKRLRWCSIIGQTEVEITEMW